MAKEPQPVEVKPAQGGRLMGGLSYESAGISNYIAKQDWRRHQDRELRAEGHEGLFLNPLVTKGIQVTPAGSTTPVTLICQARRGDGKRVIVAGNQTSLWVYTGTEDTHYVLNTAGLPDYFANDEASTTGPYVDETQYGWNRIASGLSGIGNRWESVQVGNYICLNNGVDLPLTYRPGDGQAFPIYELREQQIASVRTIAAHNGNLLCMGLWIINDAPFAALMASIAGAVSAGVGLPSMPVADPAAPNGELVAQTGGNIASSLGYYAYFVSYVTANGHTNLSPLCDFHISTIASNMAAQIALAPGVPGVTAVNIWRTYVGRLTPHSPNVIPSNLGLLATVDPGAAFYNDAESNAQFAARANTAILPPTSNTTTSQPGIPGLVSVPATTLFPGTTVVPGLTLFWTSGQAALVLSVDASGNILTDSVQVIPSGPVSLENPLAYAAYTSTVNMQNFPWRVLPSMQNAPRRFGATVPVSANLFDYQLIFKYPVRSLPELVNLNLASGFNFIGQIGGTTDIQVLFAGQGGITLNTTIIGIRNGIAMSAMIFDPVLSPVNDTGNVNDNTVSYLEASDAANSYAGKFIDLVGDGSAIIKALQLQDKIVVYKETPFVFIGTFTGDNTTPYQFLPVTIQNEAQALRYRNTLMGSGGGFYGSCHVYAGRNGFYKFDLFMQTPQQIPEMEPAQDIFFQAAIADPENAYVAENSLTKEWFFGWNAPGGNRALCFGYESRTCRMTSMTMSSASRIQHPDPTRDDWIFLFGSDDGSIQRYGLWDGVPQSSGATTVTIAGITATASAPFFTTKHVGMSILVGRGDLAELVAITGYTSPTQVTIIGSTPCTIYPSAFFIIPATWHRNGQPYACVIESGLGDLGSADGEKQVTRYVPIAGSKLQWDTNFPPFPTLLAVAFKSAVNPTAQPEWPIEALIQEPHNLCQPTFQGFYVGDRITINAINAPYALVNRIWQTLMIRSSSAGRL